MKKKIMHTCSKRAWLNPVLPTSFLIVYALMEDTTIFWVFVVSHFFAVVCRRKGLNYKMKLMDCLKRWLLERTGANQFEVLF